MIAMEIEIRSQRNNSLLQRTEIHFVIHHDGEGTPRRELVRSELADQLKTKKDHIIIDHMKSGFGIHQTIGYAKMYSSVEKAKQGEQKHLIKRNTPGAKEEKKPKTEAKEETVEPTTEEGEKPKETEKSVEPAEQGTQKPVETEDKNAEKKEESTNEKT